MTLLCNQLAMLQPKGAHGTQDIFLIHLDTKIIKICHKIAKLGQVANCGKAFCLFAILPYQKELCSGSRSSYIAIMYTVLTLNVLTLLKE